MHTLTELRAMLDARGLRPRKSLGQNFLIDKNLATRLLDAAGVGEGTLTLEVGPGAGALTEDLLARGCSVVACELDESLADLLAERFADEAERGRFVLVRGDCLASKRQISPAALRAIGPNRFTLVANLPYQAATPLMAILATAHHPGVGGGARAGAACEGQFVTIQREVADRLLAEPGSKQYGALSILTQAMTLPERIAMLPPECFWPRPEVTSAMVALRPRPEPLTRNPEQLAAVCARAFQQRRKKIGSTLAAPAGGWPAGVSPHQRPEELSVEQWIAVAESLGG